jgi:multicomponent Na+:H+ antiporter subunit G
MPDAVAGTMHFAADVLTVLFATLGAFFFLSGTVGLLRFPDVYCRLHALTKSDSLGLGCVALGLAFQASDLRTPVLLLLIWLLVTASTATVAHLLGRTALAAGVLPTLSDDGEDMSR